MNTVILNKVLSFIPKGQKSGTIILTIGNYGFEFEDHLKEVGTINSVRVAKYVKNIWGIGRPEFRIENGYAYITIFDCSVETNGTLSGAYIEYKVPYNE
jgi:hypothetical protein